jgi:hypothetical protein
MLTAGVAGVFSVAGAASAFLDAERHHDEHGGCVPSPEFTGL